MEGRGMEQCCWHAGSVGGPRGWWGRKCPVLIVVRRSKHPPPRIPSSSAATGSTSQPYWGGWREDKAWKCVGVPYTQTHFESVWEGQVQPSQAWNLRPAASLSVEPRKQLDCCKACAEQGRATAGERRLATGDFFNFFLDENMNHGCSFFIVCAVTVYFILAARWLIATFDI